MLIGYMRVSTGEQNLDLQRDALDRAGCNRIFDDVCSGRTTERPGLDKAIDIMRDGDALVVWKLDRIGRSLPHVVGLVGDLQKRGVGLKVLTGDIDTADIPEAPIENWALAKRPGLYKPRKKPVAMRDGGRGGSYGAS